MRDPCLVRYSTAVETGRFACVATNYARSKAAGREENRQR